MGQILYHTALLAPSLQDADPLSIDTRDYSVATLMDLGSVNAPPPLEHRDPGVAGPALRRRVSSAIALELVRRKLQAASRKRQALTGDELYSIGL